MSQLAAQSSRATTTTPAPDDLAALRQAVSDLQSTVKAQAEEIAKLKAKG
jgi:hypothetical protein